MDKSELTLVNIYKSIESTLQLLHVKLKEVQALVDDASYIKKLVDEVLIPTCSLTKIHSLVNLENLKDLLSRHSEKHEKLNPIIKLKKSSCNKHGPLYKVLQDKNESHRCPHPTPPSQLTPKCRPFLSSRVMYPALNHTLIQNPSVIKCISTVSKVVPSDAADNAVKIKPEVYLRRHEELTAYYDKVEECCCKLQEMFSTFTQRVLVPMQIFCKHTKTRTQSSCKLLREAEYGRISAKHIPKDIQQCEFAIVETMNQMRNLLWQSSDGAIEHLSHDYPSEILRSVECHRFPIVKLTPECVEKFSTALTCASLWLKQDQLYTENARFGFQRAQRRFTKTKNMWEEARNSHRQLCSEHEHFQFEIETNKMRLETLRRDTDALRDELLKCHKERQDIERNLLSTNGATEHLRSQHRSIRKRINVFNKKVEIKEKNYRFMDSRLRSIKANCLAAEQKVEISKEFADSLQETLLNISQNRKAWKQRYLEKVDPRILKKKLDAVGLRIPSPTVREKTFVLKTRTENLHDAIQIVSDRLKANDIHWSVLCQHLTWPNKFLVTLSKIHKQTSQKIASDNYSIPSSSGPKDSFEKFRIPTLNNESFDSAMASIERIVEFVKSRSRGSDKEQCLYMLRLWLFQSGKMASLEQLVRALQASKMNDAETRLKLLTSK